MASLDSVQTRSLLAEGVSVNNGTDDPIAIRLRYVGSGTVTSVTVTTATNIVMVTSDGGTDTFTFAAYTTCGQLADAINAEGIFEAKVLDDLRSSSSASQYVDGAITAGTDANGVVVWDVKLDTSAALRIVSTITPHRDFDGPARRVKLTELEYSVNMGTAAADSVQIYLRRGATETQVLGVLSVDTTATTIDIAGGNGYLGGAKADDEYVCLVKDAATLADADGNYVRVAGTLE